MITAASDAIAEALTGATTLGTAALGVVAVIALFALAKGFLHRAK